MFKYYLPQQLVGIAAFNFGRAKQLVDDLHVDVHCQLWLGKCGNWRKLLPPSWGWVPSLHDVVIWVETTTICLLF